MSKGIHEAAAGMLIGMRRFQSLSNNLANAGTTGYKKDMQFQRLLSEEQILTEKRKNGGQPVSIFREVQFTDFSQGELKKTGNPLDMAISGQGFFEISTPEGTAYTRNGSFTLNENSMLVDYNGNLVSGDNGAISARGANIVIDRAGQIQVDGKNIGRIKIVSFEDENQLRKRGNSLFYNAAGEEPTVNNAGSTVNQGYLEEANVNTIEEMINLITLQREFAMNEKVIKTHDEMMRRESSELGRVK